MSLIIKVTTDEIVLVFDFLQDFHQGKMIFVRLFSSWFIICLGSNIIDDYGYCG